MVSLDFSAKARIDLFDIWSFYTEVRNDVFAKVYIAELLQRFYKTIRAFPSVGQLSPEFRSSSRWITIRPYKFFFEVKGPEHVEILRIVDARRNIQPGKISFFPALPREQVQRAA